MAGIGFQLERIARNGGVGGFVSAAFHGAIVSCGPWIVTICAVSLLQIWTAQHTTLWDRTVIQTVMVYSFSASVVIAAPFALVGARLVSDLMFADNRKAVPSVVVTMLDWATVTSLAAGFLLFSVLAGLKAGPALLAMAILTLLTQVAVIGPFLTATTRPGPILLGYTGGIAAAVVIILAIGASGLMPILLTVVLAVAVTVLIILRAIKAEFPAAPSWQKFPSGEIRRVMHVGVAGLANALALWVDKWLLWWSPGGTQIVGHLRINAIYDPASFLGLLTLIPGLSLMLIMAETRLERTFSRFSETCTGTAKLSHIEDARQEVVATVLRHLRLLIVLQMVLATIFWVLAPEIFALLGYDARGIFAFRFTVVGVIFHLIVIYATVVLSYFDLFGRILLIWLVFIATSALGTIKFWDLGFAGYGWGYLAGAIAAALTSLTLLGNAVVQLTYLMFVGNNPSVAGEVRYWI
ncbi:MAG: exopolysaccharide Pel transporter PelG [Novosphingobium sp.]